MRRSLFLAMLTVATLLLNSLVAKAQHLPMAMPDEVGLESRPFALIDSAVQAEIKAGAFPGAVLAVTRHGKMVHLKAYGSKSIYPKREPMTIDNIFDLASCSKVVGTATSVMMLLDQGRLRLADPVSQYIPEFCNWKHGTKEQETIRLIHLLTHTSGLPAYASAGPLSEKYGAPSPKGMMQYIDSCNRLSEPATKFRYSCLNFITLQNVVQNITGQSLKDFAESRIFRRLGMSHTCYQPADSLLPLVVPTQRQPDGSVLLGNVHDPLARIMNGGISGNAGVFSSAADLAVYLSMILNKGEWQGTRILSPAAVKAMTSIPQGYEQFGRGLGWDLCSPYSSCKGDMLSASTVGHTGYTGTSLVADMDNDIGIVFLTNAVHPDDKGYTMRLRALIANLVASAIKDSPRYYFPHYYKRLAVFAKDPPITSRDIVMLGNSLTEGGGDWGKRLGRKHVVNRGIGGDAAIGVYDRLAPIIEGHPKSIYLMIGINDISHHPKRDSIIGDIRMTVSRICRQSPQTKLYLQSLLPFNEEKCQYNNLKGQLDEVPKYNKELQRLAAEFGVAYIDLFSVFKESGSNNLRPELTRDGLHLTPEGYDIWVKELKKTLK